MSPGVPVRAAPAGGLVHPLPMAAIALLLLNDHLGKAAFPGIVTGKLSDFAGLAFFPLLLDALVEVVLSAVHRYRGPSKRRLATCCVTTALVFAAVKLFVPANEAYAFATAVLQWPARALAALARGAPRPGIVPVVAVLDPTDLIALPSVLVAYAVGRSRPPLP